jgi:hypothetical protein
MKYQYKIYSRINTWKRICARAKVENPQPLVVEALETTKRGEDLEPQTDPDDPDVSVGMAGLRPTNFYKMAY